MITTPAESECAVNLAEWFSHAGGRSVTSVAETGDAEFGLKEDIVTPSVDKQSVDHVKR
jgi:hypothetical protein